MRTHEAYDRDDGVEPGTDRSFGLIVGGIVTLIGGYHWLFGEPLVAWLIAPGLALALAAVIRPGILRPLNLAWTKLGILLGKLVTPVVMFVIYVTTIVPIGLVMRAAGKDPLSLKRSTEGDTYWIARMPPGPPPESLKNQF